MFVKLTQAGDGVPILINFANVLAYKEASYADKPCTRIVSTVGGVAGIGTFDVRETAEEIRAELRALAHPASVIIR